MKLDIHGLIRELCEPTQHAEPYSLHRGKMLVYKSHITTAPPLLTQLAEASEPSPSAEAGLPRPAASRPAARLDAIDTLIRIDLEAARWVRDWGEDDPGDTIRCVRLVGSLSVSAGAVSARAAENDVRKWWTWARVITGWDMPAWQPDNTCPLCGTRGSLRVRVVDKLASCINDPCRETWNEDTIGLLADHVRRENQDEREAS